MLGDFWVSSIQLREWQDICNGNLQMLLFAPSWPVAGEPSNAMGKHGSAFVSQSPSGDQPVPVCPPKSPARQSLWLKEISLGSSCKHHCEIFALHLREGAQDFPCSLCVRSSHSLSSQPGLMPTACLG